MNPCSDYIEQKYLDTKLDEIIRKVEPVELQADLKQELFVILLEYDCDKLLKLKAEGRDLFFIVKILTNLAFSNSSSFYYKYRKSDREKVGEYLRRLSGTNLTGAEKAKEILSQKMIKSAKDAHESIIFNKYIESMNCSEVARYFGIPRKHVNDVVNQCRNELKKSINKNT